MGPGGRPGGAAELESERLELSQRPDGKRVQLRDLRSGEDLLFFDEPEGAELAADKERDQETDARRAAEARVLESEAMLRGSSPLPGGDCAKSTRQACVSGPRSPWHPDGFRDDPELREMRGSGPRVPSLQLIRRLRHRAGVRGPALAMGIVDQADWAARLENRRRCPLGIAIAGLIGYK